MFAFSSTAYHKPQTNSNVAYFWFKIHQRWWGNWRPPETSHKKNYYLTSLGNKLGKPRARAHIINHKLLVGISRCLQCFSIYNEMQRLYIRINKRLPAYIYKKNYIAKIPPYAVYGVFYSFA